MSATAFGFATGLFFWGYVIFEIPSNVALAKFGSRAWLARIMISWGFITSLMFFAQNEVPLDCEEINIDSLEQILKENIEKQS
jgi:hypothetical protein